MPTTAQDRVRRGPFGALLILLSLLLSSGNAAAAGNDLRGPLARPSRAGAATAVLPAGTRNPLDDEAVDFGTGPALPPAEPSLVTERLWARPLAENAFAEPTPLPRPAYSSYRARAPPAS